MLTIEEIKQRLQDRDIKQVAKNVGLHPNTIYRITQGKAESISLKTMRVLSDYLGGDKCN